MITADADAITVTRENHYMAPGTGELQTGGNGDGAAMKRVHHISINKHRRPAGASNATDK